MAADYLGSPQDLASADLDRHLEEHQTRRETLKSFGVIILTPEALARHTAAESLANVAVQDYQLVEEREDLAYYQVTVPEGTRPLCLSNVQDCAAAELHGRLDGTVFI